MPRLPAAHHDRPATYRSVFASREYGYFLAASGLSQLGDQALRVALALLVYHDSNSPLLTATAYALTFLPWVIGGPLLAGQTDRLPRRTVIIVGDLFRAGIVAVMTLPHLSVPSLLILVFMAEMIAPPAVATRSALLPDLLTGDAYIVGVSLNQVASQASQIIGFGAGGALVAAVGARGALGLDALSFVVSAALIRIALTHRYLPPLAGAPEESFWADTREGLQITLGQPAPRHLLLISWWAAAVLLVPEALAAPYVARAVHGGSTDTGWLLAAEPAGMIIGLVALGRMVRPSVRQRLMRPLAVASLLPLIAFVLRPPLPVAMALLALSGICWSFQVTLQGLFVVLIPPQARGRAFAIAASGIQISQGAGIVAGGLLAEFIGAADAIMVAGIAGAVVMLAVVAVRVPDQPGQLTAPAAQASRVT